MNADLIIIEAIATIADSTDFTFEELMKQLPTNKKLQEQVKQNAIMITEALNSVK